MNEDLQTSTMTWTQTAWRWSLALLILPLLVLTAGCDDNGDDPVTPPPPEPEPELNYVNYDTTGSNTIVVNEQDASRGIGISDADGNPINEVTWTADNTYIIDGRVFVNEGQTLTIEPGTVVKGRARVDPENASVLIVARGGTIIADGQPDSPIIFTAEEDDVSDPDDFDRRGAWGGLILLGQAPTNTASDPNIEGIPTSEARGAYGGGGAGQGDVNDNSGIVRYVSIRYGGVSIGAGNEINGLTMAGVGKGTTIEYVEVYKNLDDCFEWFGGTVDTKHLVGAYCGDDTFDIDQGFTGKGQFWFAVQDPEQADRTGEHDGGDSDLGPNGEASEPFATPQVYNATYIGSADGGAGDVALKLRDNFAGSYFNSIFSGFPVEAIEIEDLDETDTGDSRARFEEGTLKLQNNIFHNFGAGTTLRDLVENDGAFGDAVADSLDSWNNQIDDPQLANVSRLDPSLDPRPASGGPASNGAMAVPGDDFFDQVGYFGAFDPNGDNWAAGWSFTFR